MVLIEMLKRNIVAAASFLTSVGIIAAAWSALSHRYVLAEDYNREQTQQVQAIKDLRRDSDIKFERYQLQSIDDKIFYLEQQKVLTDQDKALLKRYTRQRSDTNQQLQLLMK